MLHNTVNLIWYVICIICQWHCAESTQWWSIQTWNQYSDQWCVVIYSLGKIVLPGRKKTILIRAYLTLSTLNHTPCLEEALNQFPRRVSILIGDLNRDIGSFQKPWIQKVADFLLWFGLVDLFSRFFQQLRFHHMKIWWQVRQGRLLQSHWNYIFESDLCIFDTVRIRGTTWRAIANTNSLSWVIPESTPRLPLEPTPNGTTKPCAHLVPRPEGAR